MGANTFEQVQWGPDAKTAFTAAHELAQWEHGHGGYSGTLAEKGSYVLFTLPPRVSAMKFLGWVEEAEYADGVSYAREDLARAEAALKAAPRGTVRDRQAWVRRAKQHVKTAEKERTKFLRAVGPHRDLVERVARVYHDKWGPAVALELSPADVKRYTHVGAKPKRGYRLFLFTGYASS